MRSSSGSWQNSSSGAATATSQMSRMSQFGSELQWLHAKADQSGGNVVTEECAADIEEIMKVTGAVEKVKEVAVEVKKTLHISVMIRCEISSVSDRRN